MSSLASAPAISVHRRLISRQLSLLKAYVALCKPRIIELLLITTIPAMIVAKGGLPSAWLMLATLGGGSLAAGGANAINMVIDRDIDKLMVRTQKRPLVIGIISPMSALIFAIALEIGATIVLWLTVNPLSAILAESGMGFYVLVYTLWLKRHSKQNIVIGGAAGAVPVLVGWTAITGHLALVPILMFAIVFLWTPPHFWSLAIRYRDDYKIASVPMLPAVVSPKRTANQMIIYTLLLVAASITIVPVAHLGWVYGAVALLSGAAFIYHVLRLRYDLTPKRSMKVFAYSITYLTVLFVGMAVDVFVRIR